MTPAYTTPIFCLSTFGAFVVLGVLMHFARVALERVGRKR